MLMQCVLLSIVSTTIAANHSRSPCASGVLRRGGVLLGRDFLLAGGQRRGCLHDILSELPLAGEQLLGEVVGTRDEVSRLGQVLGKRDVHIRQRWRDRPDRTGPDLDGLDHCGLALADRVQDLLLGARPVVRRIRLPSSSSTCRKTLRSTPSCYSSARCGSAGGIGRSIWSSPRNRASDRRCHKGSARLRRFDARAAARTMVTIWPGDLGGMWWERAPMGTCPNGESTALSDAPTRPRRCQIFSENWVSFTETAAPSPAGARPLPSGGPRVGSAWEHVRRRYRGDGGRYA
jgi:hypothetical protein